MPEGYKKTEVGVIPEDWEVKFLSKLSAKIMVGIASAATHAYRNRGIPLIRNQNIKPNILDDSDIIYISEEYESKFVNKRLKQGDLLTARTGYPGTTCIVPKSFDNAQSFTTLITRLITSFIDANYICFFINSDRGKEFFQQNQIGGGQKNVNAKTLKNLIIPFPPFPEQKAIAQTLSDVDALIAALDKHIAKKRNIKTGTMQQLLTGKTRLPGFGEGKGYKKSAIGVIPEDWEVRELGSLATIQRGASPRPIDSPIWYDSKSSVGWVRISDITNSDGKFLKVTQDYLSKQGISQSRYLSIGSLIMSICATVGIPVITRIESCIHDGFVGFSNLQDIDQEFLYYKFKDLETYFKSQGQTGSQSNLNSDIVRFCVIPLPHITEQKAIAQVLSDIDTEITALEKRRAKTQAIKQGMMQELLTGRTRLKIEHPDDPITKNSNG